MDYYPLLFLERCAEHDEVDGPTESKPPKRARKSIEEAGTGLLSPESANESNTLQIVVLLCTYCISGNFKGYNFRSFHRCLPNHEN